MDRFLAKFGITKGDFDLTLTNNNYSLGGVVEGTLDFHLKMPYEARCLWVELRASQRISTPRPKRIRRENGWRTEFENFSRTLSLYKHRQQLDGYHLYDQGHHAFSLPLPKSLEESKPASDVAQAAELVQTIFSGVPFKRWPVRWRVEARLEIPWNLDVTAVREIQVRESPLGKVARKRFCSTCGEKRSPDDAFCAYCGREF